MNVFGERANGREFLQPLSPRESMERLKDPYFLPSVSDIERLGSSEELRTDFKSFFSFCEHKEGGKMFEVFTQEYIKELGIYLADRISQLRGSTELPVRIMEVGAGNGRLSHFLRATLKERGALGGEVTATDSYDWKIPPLFPVEKGDYNDQIEKYQPQIVISSWMPAGLDFTQYFRLSESVKEYILIGNPETCGLPWLTWGNLDLRVRKMVRDGDFSNEDIDGFVTTPDGRLSLLAPHEAEGFRKEPLVDLHKLQICRSDFPTVRKNYFRTSHTASFKRDDRVGLKDDQTKERYRKLQHELYRIELYFERKNKELNHALSSRKRALEKEHAQRPLNEKEYHQRKREIEQDRGYEVLYPKYTKEIGRLLEDEEDARFV